MPEEVVRYILYDSEITVCLIILIVSVDHFFKFMQFKNLEISEMKPKGVISMVKRLSECDTGGK